MLEVLNLRFLVNGLAVLEPFLTACVLLAFFRSRDHLRFPALRTFLVLRLASVLTLTFLLWSGSRFGVDRHAAYVAYFYSYWFCYLAGAVAIYFVIQEMFKHVMSPLPGISRLGLLAFRWAAIISLIVAVASAVMPSGFK